MATAPFAINLHRLELFATVAKCRNFTRAAERLHISQPAVSAQVRRLERDTGVRLFWQTGREIHLTEAGIALFEYAERILALCEESQETLKEFRALKRGRVRIAATTTPGIYILPQLLGRLGAKYPNLRLEIEIGTSEHVLSQLEQFQQDIALVTEGVDQRPHLEVLPVMTDELVPIASPHSTLAGPAMVDPQRFASQRLFLREVGSKTRQRIDRHFASLAVTPTDVTELPHNEAIKQAVVSGLGYAMISRLIVSKEVAQGELVILRAPRLKIQRPIQFAIRRERIFAPIAQRFVEQLKQEIETLSE